MEIIADFNNKIFEPKILFEDNHVLAVEKPVNVPVQQDASNDIDMLNVCKNYIKRKYNKPGEAYLALLHRLDRPVGGVLVFGKTSKAAARLSKQISNREWKKYYLAVTTGVLKDKKKILENYIQRDSNNNFSKIVDQDVQSAKLAKLEFEVIQTQQKNNETFNLLKINLETGRHHQIRVQLANVNSPIWGDQRYNKNAIVGQQIALWAHCVEILHPTTKQKIVITSKPYVTTPWNEFDIGAV